jgi:hypothetical protein
LAGSWPYPEIKDFSETNALAYFVPPSATKKKFYTLLPGIQRLALDGMRPPGKISGMATIE